MPRQSARLRESDYYLADGTPKVSYRDTLRRKDTNKREVVNQPNKPRQNGMKNKLRCHVAPPPIVSPPDRGDSVKSSPKQSAPVRRETPNVIAHRVIPNKKGTPSFCVDRVTPNKKETLSFSVDRVTPNKKETHSFSDDRVTPNKKKTHSSSDDRVTPNKKETRSFSADRFTPDIESSSDTPDESARGFLGWISTLMRWFILLFLVAFHAKLFSYDVYSVANGPIAPVKGTFTNHSAWQTQTQNTSTCSDPY